jgi:predicted nucleotidyltransferase
VLLRLEEALRALTGALTRFDGVVGVVVFGSFARAEYGRRSDVDLLLLLAHDDASESSEIGRRLLRTVSEHESAWRLPMHLAPMLASARHPEELGTDLLHDLWGDGVVLYAEAAALAALQPDAMTPWTVFRFSLGKATASQRAGLSRRLRGTRQRPGIVRPPGVVLGRGALLVPPALESRVRDALDIAGATYDAIPVWRPT